MVPVVNALVVILSIVRYVIVVVLMCLDSKSTIVSGCLCL